MLYGNISKGYKSGGFNATAPMGLESYGQETNWTYEIGAKTSWLNGRVQLNTSLFYIDWKDLQLDQPNPFLPGRYYIDNAGEATSKGLEIEALAEVAPGWVFFGGVGLTEAKFKDGAMAISGADPGDPAVDVGGNRLPFAPDYTWFLGTQIQQSLTNNLTIFGRAEVNGLGRYYYDAINGASQSSFELVNFRIGIQGRQEKYRWRAEFWIRNAFDTDYVPIAFPFATGLAPSGYLGEAGTPRTLGGTILVEF